MWRIILKYAVQAMFLKWIYYRSNTRILLSTYYSVWTHLKCTTIRSAQWRLSAPGGCMQFQCLLPGKRYSQKVRAGKRSTLSLMLVGPRILDRAEISDANRENGIIYIIIKNIYSHLKPHSIFHSAKLNNIEFSSWTVFPIFSSLLISR